MTDLPPSYVWLRNPFDDNLISERRRESRDFLKIEPIVFYNDLMEKNKYEDAEKFMLAFSHWQVCSKESMTILRDGFIRDGEDRELPHGVAEYRNLLNAAGRAYEAISELRGTSAALWRIKKQTWAACFGGGTLDSALLFENIIKEHNVCILGETGTGKELIARAISGAVINRKNENPIFNSINVSAFSSELIESELFGHVRGAFTGATLKRVGLISKSDNGVFFLDEVGDLPLATQVKLLRVIQEGELIPVGSDKSQKLSVRFVSATNRNLKALVKEKEFREDLYYRLSGTIIETPPLRDRIEDIGEIVGAYIEKKGMSGIVDPKLILNKLQSKEFISHDWPGNVRELQTVVRNIILDLPVSKPDSSNAKRHKNLPVQQTPRDIPLEIIEGKWTLDQVTEWYIHFIYDGLKQNQSAAARLLGVERNTVRTWIEKNGKTQ